VPPEAGALVTGATSLVGGFLLEKLRERGVAIHAISRSGGVSKPGVVWDERDIAHGLGPPQGRARYFFHLAPLWLLPELTNDLLAWGVERLIAFGSTSRFTKAGSSSAKERELAARLAAAEESLAARARALGIAWTLFRPTLIYGQGRDANVSAIGRFVQRFGFFPIAGRGTGRRQPVHAEDLALACLQAMDNPTTFGRAYDLVGGTTLTYREMVETVFRGMGRRPRLVHVPTPVLRAALAAASWLPGLRHVTPGMADRMDQDLTFDATAAATDFGYAPRPFRFPE